MVEKQGSGRGKINAENPFVKRKPKRFKRKKTAEYPQMTRGTIRRLARRGGVKRVSMGVYSEMNDFIEYFLILALKNSAVFAEHAKRRTITAIDVIYALKRLGRTLYGYGP